MVKKTPRVIAVSTSTERGTKKWEVEKAILKRGFGIEGDAHAGRWRRQISLLAVESINKMRRQGFEGGYGDFAENLTTEGIDLVSLPVGTKLKIGKDVLLQISQVGKICHMKCDVFRRVGGCIMPEEGVFARVIAGGTVEPGDSIVVVLEDYCLDTR